ncbi:unnamed protein product [Cylindrotheca closterium]|uniref:Prokaryotic-type class I peptide chain release factors domain-containing protein n=1 Tax=Cylindrotheca closterium TaxID=2856 RepID=A0AAD2G0N5_9STRA|nr:unnamed protein product [Cylindrotheca closterium]
MFPKGSCLAFQKHIGSATRQIRRNAIQRQQQQQQQQNRHNGFLPTFASPSLLLKRVPHPPAGTTTTSWQLHQSFTTANDGDSGENSTQNPISLNMENLYREWTLEQDKLLWENKDSKSIIELASLLGRGLNGVQARLSKLQDLSSPAYERLFVTGRNGQNYSNKIGDDSADNDSTGKQKLVPAGEVLRRIEYDYRLQEESSNFFVLHYDRVDDVVVESPLNAPNDSIQGSATMLVKALPEHRIVGIKYKERIVWDRAERLDLVFGNGDEGGGIYHIIDTYGDWKAEQDRVVEWNRQRQKFIAQRIQHILGAAYYKSLQQQSSDIKKAFGDDTISIKSMVEAYVQSVLSIFRSRRRECESSDTPTTGGEMQGEEPFDIPQTDFEALEEFSELVAVLPDPDLRSLLLTEISLVMDRLEGKGSKKNGGTAGAGRREPLVLLEEELSERFVRGSGAGGQKINKTSNRVVLVHEPTQLKVECQDTRSLSQNRKIARKRLLEKLDEHFHGKQSKIGWKNQKAVQKRQKSKTKNRARQRKKQLEKQDENGDEI